MKIIVGSEYYDLRELYEMTFSKGTRENFEGNGYIWENLTKYNRKSESYCLEYIRKKKDIYVMWDTLEKIEILDQNYWKYPKESLLQLSVNEFFQLFTTFPDDIYVFDDAFNWSIIFTHEDVFDKKRYCLMLIE